MKIFRKTWFALLLCMLVMLASTLLNTRVRFGAKCAALNESMTQAADSAQAHGLWQDFMNSYDRFPTRQLASLAGVEYPVPVE